jgi:hypothetical protein
VTFQEGGCPRCAPDRVDDEVRVDGNGDAIVVVDDSRTGDGIGCHHRFDCLVVVEDRDVG